MAVFLTACIALAAALLGVAAARRGWWTHATTAGACTLLAVYASIFFTQTALSVPVWVAVPVIWTVLGLLAATAWSTLRDREKTGGAS